MDDDRRTRLKHVLIFALIIGLLVALIMLDKKDDTTQDSIRVQTTSQDLISVRAARYLKAVEDDRTKARSIAGKPDAGTVRLLRQPDGAVSSRTWVATGPSNGGVPSDETWWDLFGCETGGTFDPAINTGNGYYGGFQFDLPTWQSVGGTGYPHEHSYETQRKFAIRLWELRGWAPWPKCSQNLGLT